jgi:hypothetical protein
VRAALHTQQVVVRKLARRCSPDMSERPVWNKSMRAQHQQAAVGNLCLAYCCSSQQSQVGLDLPLGRGPARQCFAAGLPSARTL